MNNPLKDSKLTPVQKGTAAAYARCFGSDAGKRVLHDLNIKFGTHRPRFNLTKGPPDALTAAVMDGQAQVMIDIQAAIELGQTFSPPTNQPTQNIP